MSASHATINILQTLLEFFVGHHHHINHKRIQFAKTNNKYLSKKNAWPDTKCKCLPGFNKKNLKSSYRRTLSLISLSGSVANNIFTKVVFPLSTAIYKTVFPSYNNTNRSPCIYRLMSPRCLMTKDVFPKIHDQHRKASIAVFLLKIPSYHQEFECSVNHLKNILCTNLSFSIYVRIFS